MQGIQYSAPISKVTADQRRPGPVRREDKHWAQKDLSVDEMKVDRVTGLGLKKRVAPPKSPKITSHHGPELPHGPRRQIDADWEHPDRGLRPKPVPIRENLHMPHGPHRKADPDFYRDEINPITGVASPPRENRKPIEITSNNAQTLMYVPKGPHRRTDRHWDQVPSDSARRAAQNNSSAADRKAPGRGDDRPHEFIMKGPVTYTAPSNNAGHKFYKQNEEGQWESSRKTSVPEPVIMIRKANESSFDMPLSSPTAKYNQNHFSSPKKYERPSEGNNRPGFREERILDPSIHHSVAQKGYRKFRNRDWHTNDSSATISPRVRVGTANKPSGFNLPSYEHMPRNDPVTRIPRQMAREALQYPEQRKLNQESIDMFNGLPDPRGQQGSGRPY